MSMLSPLMDLMKNMGLNAVPNLNNNELKIEINEEDLKNALTKNVNEQMKQAISLELHEKKLIIKVRLI